MPETEFADSRPRPYHHRDLRRALIDAALALVTEQQNWTFSLREVARRAGVSHNAPYNHFAEKQDLLVAVAAAGFERLRDRMRAAIAGIEKADAALLASGRAYVECAVANPALYRLMFGPELAKAKGERPVAARTAGADAKAVLAGIVLRGAQTGVFAVSPDDAGDQGKIVLAALAAVHGATMLLLDGFTEPGFTIGELLDGVERTVLDGLIPRSGRPS
jgi:AcrR family transcriptional regulator